MFQNAMKFRNVIKVYWLTLPIKYCHYVMQIFTRLHKNFQNIMTYCNKMPQTDVLNYDE